MSKVCCAQISKITFKISCKTSKQYIDRYVFYTTLTHYEILDIKVDMRFGNPFDRVNSCSIICEMIQSEMSSNFIHGVFFNYNTDPYAW